MPEIKEEIEKRHQMLDDWLQDRPQIIKDLADKISPFKTYVVKETGQLGTVYSFSENGTLTLNITGHKDKFRDAMEKLIPLRVFGFRPEDLEEYELPT